MGNEREDREYLSKKYFDKARQIKLDSHSSCRAAFNLLSRALAEVPTYLQALLLRCQIAIRLSEWETVVCDAASIILIEEKEHNDHKKIAGFCGTKANAFRKMSNPDSAIKELQRAHELEPDNGVWLYELGNVYLHAEQYVIAQSHYINAIREKMNDTLKCQALTNLGLCRLNTFDLSGATSALLKAIALCENCELHHLLGLAFYWQGQFKNASTHFVRSTDLSPLKAEYHTHLGVCTYKMDLFPDAARQLSEAVQRGEKSPEVLYFRGCANIFAKLIPHAITDLEEAIRGSPSDARFFYVLGLVHATCEGGNGLQAASESFERALQLDPSFRSCLAHMGLLCHEEGNLFGALEYLHKALDFDDTDALLLERIALVYYDLQYFDLALKYFNRCLEIDPESSLFLYRKGVAELALGNADRALEILARTIDELGFQDPSAFHARARALLLLGKAEEALPWCTLAIEVHSVHPKYLLNRAQCYYYVGDFERSLADTNIALKLCPEWPELHYLHGQVCFAIGDVSTTLTDFQEASRLHPALLEQSSYCYSLGVTQAHNNLLSEAVVSFTNAIERASEVSVSYFHERAKALQVLGDAAGALRDFSVVIENDPLNFNALTRRSFAYKTLELFKESSEDWERAKKLDKLGLLDSFSRQDVFKIDYLELSLPGDD